VPWIGDGNSCRLAGSAHSPDGTLGWSIKVWSLLKFARQEFTGHPIKRNNRVFSQESSLKWLLSEHSPMCHSHAVAVDPDGISTEGSRFQTEALVAAKRKLTNEPSAWRTARRESAA
jgi:hypothetical protein